MHVLPAQLVQDPGASSTEFSEMQVAPICEEYLSMVSPPFELKFRGRMGFPRRAGDGLPQGRPSYVAARGERRAGALPGRARR